MDIHQLFKQLGSIRAVVRETGYSRNTVRRMLRASDSPPKFKTPRRSSGVEPFKEYLARRYGEFGLSAPRLLEEIRAQGFTGSIHMIRRFLTSVRPLRVAAAKATVRFETPPGQQAQADWAERDSTNATDRLADSLSPTPRSTAVSQSRDDTACVHAARLVPQHHKRFIKGLPMYQRHLAVICFLLLCMSFAANAEDATRKKGIFVRVENLSEEPAYVRMIVVVHRDPFGYGWSDFDAMYISRKGLQKTSVPPKEEWLSRGTSTAPNPPSPWIDVSAFNPPGEVDFGRDEGTYVFLALRENSNGDVSEVPIAVTVASEPAEHAIVRRVVAPNPGEPLAVIIRSDVRHFVGKHPGQETEPKAPAPRPAPIFAISNDSATPESLVYTVWEDAQATLDYVKGLPLAGRPPQRIRIGNYQLADSVPFSKIHFPRLARMHLEVLGRLGCNTIGFDPEKRDLPASFGIRNLIAGSPRVYRAEPGRNAQDIDWTRTEQQIEAEAKRWRSAGALSDLAYVHLEDEPWYASLEQMRSNGACNAAFREFLRQRGVPLKGILDEEVLKQARSEPNALLFVEAEGFDSVSGQTPWRVLPAESTPGAQYFGNAYLWTESFDGPRLMQKTIQIPRAGLYRIWVRRELPAGKNAIFYVGIQQGKDLPSIERPFGVNAEVSASAWECMEVRLKEGQTTLTIRKNLGRDPRDDRRVDCFLLTTDMTYQPNDDALRKTLQGAKNDGGTIHWQGPPSGDAIDPWQYVTLGVRADAASNPLLYYLSCEFRRGEWTRIFSKYTALVKKHFGDNVQTSAK